MGLLPPPVQPVIILRTVGDGSTKPGEPVANPTLPASMSVIGRIVDSPHFTQTYAPVQMPANATSVTINIDRNNLVGPQDGYLISAYIDISLDGGVTWGGAFLDKSQGQVPGSFALQAASTFGLLESSLLPNAFFGLPLPPDQGFGRMVRFAVGAKTPVDIGVSYYPSNDPLPPRPLLADLHHSVSLDTTTGTAGYAASTSLSFSHAGAASPTDYYARASASYTSVLSPVSTGKWDTAGTNTTMTSVPSALITSSAFQVTLFGLANLLYLINPTHGTVTVTLANGGNGMYGRGASVSTWQGAHQTSPNGTAFTASGTGTAPTVSVTGTAATSYITDAMAAEYISTDTTPAVTASKTNISSGYAVGNGQVGGSQYAAGTGGTVAMSWTIGTDGTRHWITSACEILQSSAAVVIKQLAALGAG